jgi:pilus assembly protein Flp/PilA
MHVLTKLHLWVRGLDRDDRGASLVEYALLVSLIAVVALVAVGALGGSVSDQFDDFREGLGG